MINRGGGCLTPPPAKPPAQIAAETGCSLLSTHMASGEREGAESTSQSRWDPPIYQFHSLGLFLSNQGLQPSTD